MQSTNTSKVGHENWSSRFGFLMASVGFAVGLGNIWKFPYITGENGGGAFVVVYILCAIAICVPILMAEVLIGRRGKQSPNVSMKRVAVADGKSSRWGWLGGMTMATAFIILLVYSVVAGWVLKYLFIAIQSGFADLTNSTVSSAMFDSVLSGSGGMVFWTAMVLAICGLIVSSGIRDGIERAVVVLMPVLFVLLLVMVGYAAYAGDFAAGADFLFNPDFSKINASVVLIAVGQAFFSVGVAMAGMMAYGAYLPQKVSIGRSVGIIVFADTLVAILAGLAIFPLVFEHGFDPEGGPGLIFKTLPVAFANMAGGHFFSVVFFSLLSVAAITSMVGLLEPLVSWAEEHKAMSRRRFSVILVSSILVLSLSSIFSYNSMAGFQPLNWLPGFGGKNINDILGFLTDQLMLPLGGLLIAIFAGWVLSPETAENELAPGKAWHFTLWRFLIRFIVPPAVFLVLILGLAN
jgi:NSS family neurotransmitter:Na+ symporter